MIKEGKEALEKLDTERAISIFDTAVKVVPNDSRIRLFRAEAFLQANRFFPASKDLNIVLKYEPKNIQVCIFY